MEGGIACHVTVSGCCPRSKAAQIKKATYINQNIHVYYFLKNSRKETNIAYIA